MGAVAPVLSALSVFDSSRRAKKQEQAQRDALEQQRIAEEQARKDAIVQQKKSERAVEASQRKAPDVETLLTRSRTQSGVSSTMLTGVEGIDPNKLKLGKKTLLGG